MDISYVGDLNERITREGVRNILLVQEALQGKDFQDRRQIVADGSRKFIMIAPSSSGKTSFSHRLSIQLTAEAASDRCRQLFQNRRYASG